MSVTVPLYGFGSGGAGAILTVTAPAGVTVRVSNGSKIKTKTADSMGQAVFRNLDGGIWNVTITDGTQTASRQVTITSNYTMDIDFLVDLYNRGNQCTAVTGGWHGCNEAASSAKGTFVAGESYLSVTNASGASYGAGTVNAVDMTGYTILHAIVSRQESGTVRLMAGATFPGDVTGAAEETAGSSEIEMTLDISQINGMNQVLIRPKGNISSALYIHKVWIN